MKRHRVVVAFVCFLGLVGTASAGDLTEYIAWQKSQSIKFLFKNVSPPDAAKGVVVAASSKTNPDYYYHWIRDASLVADTIVDLYINETDPKTKAGYEQALVDFVAFSRRNQLTPTPSGHFGEPKFLIDGRPFTGAWGRPQNDGPALRAVALTRLALRWIDEGKIALVRERLYDGRLPSATVVKEDLEFVSQHWRDKCFDLWEEISGYHFYTRMAQRRALLDGAALAERLGDPGAAGWYRKQATALEAEIAKHWDPKRGLVVPTLERNGGIDYKNSGIDASVLIGALHGATADGFFGVTDDRMLATFIRTKDAFTAIYPINAAGPGTAIGRYPEDRYDGLTTGGEGNPWFLLTLGFAEFLYRGAAAIESQRYALFTPSPLNRPFLAWLGLDAEDGKPLAETQLKLLVSRMRAAGDAFVQRAERHVNSEGRFAEQINRRSGFMQGAPDLTWSYASFLTAALHRTPAFLIP